MGIKFGTGPALGAGVGFGGIKIGKPADPLENVPYGEGLAEDAAAELTAMEEAYRARATAEVQRFRAATDSEYWFAVCFTSREEKEAFLRAAGLAHLGDKYLEGPAVARALDIAL